MLILTGAFYCLILLLPFILVYKFMVNVILSVLKGL